MDFTFGIITDGNYDYLINDIINSIEIEKIPNYEIIIVGNSKVNRVNTIVVPFDEHIKSMWITKKKNIITQKSKYENIVFLHDYIRLCPGWYDGYLKFGNDFKACMNIILNLDDTRYRDWVLWENPVLNGETIVKRAEHIIPYYIDNLSRYMYFSGAYWVAKKEIMEKYPLNEELVWNRGEDIEWSKKYRESHDFVMNTYSSVKLMKKKDPVYKFLTDEETIKKLIELG